MSDQDEYSDDELNAIRQRRYSDLQRAAIDEQRQTEARRQFDAQKQAALKLILTPEARQRLTNIRMVKPEFADQIEVQLIQLAQTGRVKVPISDDELKQALSRLQSQRKDIHIRRA
ncbi:MAG TPA: DNA-binding protein [Candidatus Saccharimonadales bacterium]|jgi:programmed cell death protein 5|nr:DNA-binding protein [Candidatus Saccharimonadales bacterium]